MRAGGAGVVLVAGELSPADATGDDDEDDDDAAGAGKAARGGHGRVRGEEDEGCWARHSDKGTCTGNNRDGIVHSVIIRQENGFSLCLCL